MCCFRWSRDAALFRALGALVDELPPGPDGVPKLLPRRDVATVDAILLREAPAADDADTLRPIKRLQDAGVHFMDNDVLRSARNRCRAAACRSCAATLYRITSRRLCRSV